MNIKISSRPPTALGTVLRTALSATLLCSAALSGAAFAQSSTTNRSSMANMPMSYIALGVGATDLSQTNHDWGFFPNETLGHATHIAFGTYGPQQNLGFEVGYTNFGNVSRSGGTTRAEGINLSLIGRLPLSDTFNLMGKVGGTYGHTDISAAAGSGASTGTVDGFDWSYGVGAELALMPSVSAVLQYDEHYMKFAGDHSNRVNATTVGLRYRF